jgi:uncharacterized protein YejL (UPF0352 family)
MTTDEKLKLIVAAVATTRRETIRTLARTKALESMLEDFIPAAERDVWNVRLNEQTKQILQTLLESLEKHDPAAAAFLDNREPWEIPGQDENTEP